MKTCRCGNTYDPPRPNVTRCPDCLRQYKLDSYHRNKHKRKPRKYDPSKKDYYVARHKRDTIEQFLLRLVARARRATKKGIECDLSRKYLLGLWISQAGRCAVTGMEMLHKTGDLRSVSVDRIDGKYGYTKGNVQLVCQWVNFAKNSRSTEEIQAILTEYVTWHNASSVKPLVI